MSSVESLDRDVLAELAPLARRASALDPRTVVRLRVRNGTATLLARLPFAVLVSRSVATTEADVDVAVGAAELISWLDGDRPEPPAARDADWRSGLPPARGWHRLDTIPDDVIRPLVRAGALTLKEAAEREGVPGAQPRAEVADALLDSVVLTVTDDAGQTADVTLRAVSALTRMGFLPREGAAHVDVCGRWIRVAAQYGTVYLERPGGLVLR